MDFEKKSYTQPYAGLFHEMKLMDTELMSLPQFPYSAFDSAFAFYVWNCEKSHGLNTQESKDIGVLELSGRFSKAPKENLILIIMLSYEHSFKIDSNRNVTFDENSSKMISKKKIVKK